MSKHDGQTGNAMDYNPAQQVDPEEWLSLDEAERLYAIECWVAELTGLDIEDCVLEAVPILAVENQVAMDDPPVSRATLERLLAAGLDQVTAIDAMSDVMAESLAAVTSGEPHYDAADIGQLGGVDAPHPACQRHGAFEGCFRQAHAMAVAAGTQHLSVKWGIVGGQEIDVLEQRAEPRPDLAEIGCIAHIVPIETVDMGEHELAGRRADEMCLAVDNAAIAGNHHAHRAGTIGAAVGSFEVDGGKTHGREFIPAVSALSTPDRPALD